MHACIARQPILDRNQDVYGYELLFRSGPENVFDPAHNDHATTRVVGDTLYLHGLERLTQGRKCFLNLTREALLEGLFKVLPPENLVLELLETIDIDDATIEACRKLREAGYMLALDDYALDAQFDRLLPLIDVLKVDFERLDSSQRREVAANKQKFGYTLLAEKVETHEDFAEAKHLGYDLFQGYFFCRPEVITNKALQVSRMNSVRLIKEINQPSLNLDELAEIISQDVSLSYKLLRYLNSAAFRFRHRITTIRHALTLLGDRQIRMWASLMAIRRMGNDKPHELTTSGLIRAHFCEAYGLATGLTCRSTDLFMMGLFSIIDAMLDRPLPEILAEIPIPEEVSAALLHEPSSLRPYLDLVQAFETGRWRHMDELLERIGNPDLEAAAKAYQDAIIWAAQLNKEFIADDAAPAAA